MLVFSNNALLFIYYLLSLPSISKLFENDCDIWHNKAMKRVYDPKNVEKYVNRYHIHDYFDSSYPFYLMEYEKEEMMIHPLKDTKEIQFVVEGEVSIYFIDSNGKQLFVSQTNELCVLGDVEFVRHEKPVYFAQTNTKVVTIALSIEENQLRLNQDLKFLHFLLNSLVDKLHNKSTNEIMNQSVEEKVMNYMELHPTLDNVSVACRNLHCSRRQLQRVLKKLCEDKRIVRLEKGKYVLQ